MSGEMKDLSGTPRSEEEVRAAALPTKPSLIRKSVR
jgi:hypothetical protein